MWAGFEGFVSCQTNVPNLEDTLCSTLATPSLSFIFVVVWQYSTKCEIFL